MDDELNEDNDLMKILLKETITRLLKKLTPKLYKLRFDDNNTVLKVAKEYSGVSLVDLMKK